jgi:hypothetical protein
MFVTVIARHAAAKLLMRCCGGDVVFAPPELSAGPRHQRRPARRRMISPAFVAGADFLVSGRRVWAGEATTQ